MFSKISPKRSCRPLEISKKRNEFATFYQYSCAFKIKITLQDIEKSLKNECKTFKAISEIIKANLIH